jgi:UDP-GlcNAc3NAcA epimerase
VKVLSVVGARPQFVKAAVLSRALAEVADIEEVMVHTGQHFDRNMSELFFEELEMAPPRFSLGIHGGEHGAMTGRMLEGLEQIMITETPDWVLVYGDTNSTLAGALAGAKLHLPVAHVEAGLRSWNRRMPEEINRVLTDHASTLLFCPTRAAVDNLTREGIVRGVHHVGDVMFDATLYARGRAQRSDVLDRLDLQPGQYAVATVHRAENTDDPDRLAEVLAYLRKEATSLPVVLPLHPRTRAAVEENGQSLAGLRTCHPLGYLDMTRLVSECRAVFTDSGGLQKEAYFHCKPCVTLREETEWVETIECGWNRLWSQESYRPRRDISDYGDGHAAQQMVALLQAAPVPRSTHVSPALSGR